MSNGTGGVVWYGWGVLNETLRRENFMWFKILVRLYICLLVIWRAIIITRRCFMYTEKNFGWDKGYVVDALFVRLGWMSGKQTVPPATYEVGGGRDLSLWDGNLDRKQIRKAVVWAWGLDGSCTTFWLRVVFCYFFNWFELIECMIWSSWCLEICNKF